MNIKLDDTSITLLKNTLRAREQELEKQLSSNPLFIEIQQLKELLSKIDGANKDIIEPKEEVKEQSKFYALPYDKKWSIMKKGEYILGKEGRSLTTAEIVKEIMKHEPQIDRVTMIKNISGILGSKEKAGLLFTRKFNSYGDIEWGLIDWIK